MKLIKLQKRPDKNPAKWPQASDGHEVTWMPYGPQGAGYYVSALNSEAAQ